MHWDERRKSGLFKIARTMSVLGDRWTMLVRAREAFIGTTAFDEFVAYHRCHASGRVRPRLEAF